MPRSLVVPGVSIETRFDVTPPLPARSGILGAVGVVDKIPKGGLRSITSSQELLEIHGPASRYSFPEVFSALANGVSEVVLSPVDPRSGQLAHVTVYDDENEAVAVLRARAVGPWANDLSVRIDQKLGADQRTVRRVRLQVLYRGQVVETHDDLVMRAGSDSDFFQAINNNSNTIVAIDPLFETDLPVVDTERRAFIDSQAATATGALVRNGAVLISVAAAHPGVEGNRISLEATPGRASRGLADPNGDPSLLLRARLPGSEGIPLRVRIEDSGSGGVHASIQGANGDVRVYRDQTSLADLVRILNTDPDVLAESTGDLLPAPTGGLVALAETCTVTVRVEGVSTVVYPDLASAQAILDALNTSDTIVASLVGDPSLLPVEQPANAFYLQGGRSAGLAQVYEGQNNPGSHILELLPASGTDGAVTRFQVTAGTLAGTVRITTGKDLGQGYTQQEDMDNLSMDPDDDRYLPRVLAQESRLLTAFNRHLRSRATHFPQQTIAPLRFSGGACPTEDAYAAAIDALAAEDSVDMLMAGLQGWADPNLNGVEVQQAMLGHARSQADNARPRIALGSIKPSENTDVPAILNHASQVSGRRFVLVAPAGAEGALAGLLGHLSYFQSPTFKKVASPGVPLVPYSDGQLNKLVGPDGNTCVIQQRRGRGTICVKGISTDGFQISVSRVADRCVREVKAISDRFIGELNNNNSRQALKQMILATFTQMEREGALVPSVDGSSPAFMVEVYASQMDAAAGIARIDIAVRPVRAIDYIYATIQIKN